MSRPSSGWNSVGSVINMPKIKEGTITGWSQIATYLSKSTFEPQEEIAIELNSDTVVPGEVLQALQDKDVTVTFRLSNGIEWIVSGGTNLSQWQEQSEEAEQEESGEELQDDKSALEWQDIDWKVTLYSGSIPKDVQEKIENVENDDKIPFSLAFDGNFGFTAKMRINIREENAGRIANLFFYNPETEELEFVTEALVDDEGNCELDFTHASNYIIVIDEGEILRQEMDNIKVTPDEKDTLY